MPATAELDAVGGWGNEKDFWTEDDSEPAETTTVGPETEPSVVGSETPPDLAVPGWLEEFEKARKELPEGSYLGSAEGFKSNLEVSIPVARVSEPEQVNGGAGFIRKRWAIEDSKNDMGDFETLVPPEERAMTHPFPYDPFQKRAIYHVHNNEHTFVCAHTSAGKTVVAEYGIAMALKNGMRAIYTSPIKALSNQKYREFRKQFDSVGIITGDVAIDTSAQCLIMTTEILRNLLYRSDGIVNQTAVVIYDEVHYVNDPDRGVVWEETIIMMPPQITMILLSATVPNYLYFADWIGTTKQREVFVISTKSRPIPLKHSLYFEDKLYLLMDYKGKFDDHVYNKVYSDSRNAKKVKENHSSRGGKRGRGGSNFSGGHSSVGSADPRRKNEKQRLAKLIALLREADLLPTVCFSFSRKKCEELADALVSGHLLSVTSDQRSKCHTFIKQSISNLSEGDRLLPQIKMIETFVMNGVGVHHGGMLPIVKEIVEILFSRQLIQVLFATETFSMGINMPARSVVLTSIYKHDGRKKRCLFSSEYTQMAGRAGRRGLDANGNVIIFCSEEQPPNHLDLSSMMLHKATPLQSKFRITFGMLLQLLSRNNQKPIDMLSKSFKECLRAQQLPILRRDLQRFRRKLESLPPIRCIFGTPDIENYIQLDNSCRTLGFALHQSLFESKFCGDVFCPGRVLLVHSLPFTLSACYGLILSVQSERRTADQMPFFLLLVMVPNGIASEAVDVHATYTDGCSDPEDIEILQKASLDPVLEGLTVWEDIQFAIEAGEGNYVPAKSFAILKNVPLDRIVSLMSAVVQVGKEDIDIADSLEVARHAQSFNAALKSQWKEMTSFVIPKKMKYIEVEHVMATHELKQSLGALTHNKCHTCPKKETNGLLERSRKTLQQRIDRILFEISDSSLDLIPDLKARLQYLRQNGYLETNGAIALKGRAACEILATDELTLIQAIFDHVLHDKSPPAIVAILSAFVFPENCEDESVLFSEEVESARVIIEEIHAQIARDLVQLGVQLNYSDWQKLCNFQFAPIAFRWALGQPFTTLVEKTTLQEGTIVRTIVRLDEIIRKIRNTAHLMGDFAFKAVMEKASEIIHRDIVFAASLYFK